MGTGEKIARGKLAVAALGRYKEARKTGDGAGQQAALTEIRANEAYLGYGYLNSPEEAVPPVALTFYSFRLMVFLGTFFMLVMLAFFFFAWRDRLDGQKWLLRIGVGTLFLGYLASEMGWVVAEVGRQPWAIQDLLPVTVANSNLTTGSVQTTFFLFLAVFTTLLVAEIGIMLKQIKTGPEDH